MARAHEDQHGTADQFTAPAQSLPQPRADLEAEQGQRHADRGDAGRGDDEVDVIRAQTEPDDEIVDAQCSTHQNQPPGAWLRRPGRPLPGPELCDDRIGAGETEHGAPDGLGPRSQVMGHGVAEEDADHGHGRLEHPEYQGDPSTKLPVDARDAQGGPCAEVVQADREGDQEQRDHSGNVIGAGAPYHRSPTGRTNAMKDAQEVADRDSDAVGA
jgi:hypothetical protein